MIQSEIFIYILALVVASLIFLYGYSAITKMKKQTDTVALAQFKQDLPNLIKSLGYDFGTEKKETMDVPSGYTQVCFVQLEEDGGDPGQNAVLNDMSSGYGVIANSVRDGVKNNVFLMGNGAAEPFYGGKISLPDADRSFRCFNVVDGKIGIVLKSLGKTVEVSPP
jgi:hypothetical protein